MRPTSFIAVAVTLLAVHQAQAIYAQVREDIRFAPVSRLTENISQYIKKHPKDADGYYTLARLHSIAYAQKITQPAPTVSIVRGNQVREEQVVGQPEQVVEVRTPEGEPELEGSLPRIDGYGMVQRDNPARPISVDDLYHLRESVRNYIKATELAPKESWCWLGMGWMYEQGAPYAAQLGAVWEKTPSKTKISQPAEWRARALAAYRRTYALQLAESHEEFYNSSAIEAGECVLRMLALSNRQLTPKEQNEAKQIRLTIEKIKKRPILISPIILPLTHSASLLELLSPRSSVAFDLTGDNLGRRWPWVKPATGILVWDPEHKGQINSGRQLFGSVTWWVFWKNGYQALAALDNDANGQLTGAELEGISIWQDANSNGISERGEVKPLGEWGIVALSTQVTQRVGNTPANLKGATLKNGTLLPTYDWTPKSLN